MNLSDDLISPRTKRRQLLLLRLLDGTRKLSPVARCDLVIVPSLVPRQSGSSLSLRLENGRPGGRPLLAGRRRDGAGYIWGHASYVISITLFGSLSML